ncbi:hypothetical protein GCM10009780_07680 [Actinomadura alba]
MRASHQCGAAAVAVGARRGRECRVSNCMITAKGRARGLRGAREAQAGAGRRRRGEFGEDVGKGDSGEAASPRLVRLGHFIREDTGAQAVLGPQRPPPLPADLTALIRRGRTVDGLDDLQQRDLGGAPCEPESSPRSRGGGQQPGSDAR